MPAPASGPAASGTPDRAYLAALWMAGAIFGFSAMALSGRALTGGLAAVEIMLWRSVIGIVMVGALAQAMGRTRDLAPRAMGLQLLRNTSHFVGQNAWLSALALIPLAQLFAIEFSYPIIVALVAPLLLGERLSLPKVLSALAGFVGILIVARPFGGAGMSPGMLMAMLAALGFAGSAIVTKWLTRRVSTVAILFWMSVMQAVMALPLVVLIYGLHWPTAHDWLFLVLVTAAGLVGHLSLTTALSLAPASIVTPMDFLRLPLIAVIGAAFYAEPFDPLVLLGGAVIFAANWANLILDGRARRRGQSAVGQSAGSGSPDAPLNR